MNRQQQLSVSTGRESRVAKQPLVELINELLNKTPIISLAPYTSYTSSAIQRSRPEKLIVNSNKFKLAASIFNH